MSFPRALIAAALPLLAGSFATARAQPPSPAGLYRAQAGPDTAAMLELGPDGRFRYQLSEGALDEVSAGRWTAGDKGSVTLETQPHPRKPEFRLGEIGEAKDSSFTIQVMVQGGGSRGLAGMDFRIGYTNGDIAAGYTQEDGWSMAPDDKRQPAWIEIIEPIHAVASQRFALPDRRNMAVTVTIVPNDIGIADFRDLLLTKSDTGLIMHWRERDIPFARAGRLRPGP